ncbi:LPS ABC transporter substrate-binding protein LptA [Pseudomonas sp. ODNR1LW]|nr:LPS ABC transporter substrate-binding protein LptA [Pseudomonas sp. ODNR1LW]
MTAMTSKTFLGRAAAALTALGLLALPAVGDAQSSRSTSNQPIAIGADDGEYATDRISLRGRAEVTQGDNRLRAEAMTAYRDAQGQITRVEATGTVYFVTPTQSMRGDRAVYTLSNGELVVTGNVILNQGKNVLTGGRLVYNVNTDAATMSGAPRAGAGSRIQGVFYPDGTN